MKKNHKTQGFTLVELMIAVAIIGILAAISYPMYTANTRSAKRADAQAALISLVNALEQWKMQQTNPNNGYSDATLGVGGIFPDTVPLAGGTPNYTLRLEITDEGKSYKLVATPVMGDDSEFTLDNMGTKTCSTSQAKDSWCVNDTW
jgi:type IV pilus assembly protein PilE